ncbi:hypothetical protein AB0O52_05750 [Arthrobacter sp. NPDC080073]
MPAGEGFDGPADLGVLDVLELAGQPPFEEREVVVAVREQFVVGEQAA